MRKRITGWMNSALVFSEVQDFGEGVCASFTLHQTKGKAESTNDYPKGAAMQVTVEWDDNDKETDQCQG